MAEEQTTQPLQALSNSQQESGQNDPEQRKANVRRRTKTGCLTCRKRRIKCDEGRPICNNCIKSKRQCEGYNQRVIFKEPMNALAGSFNPAVHPDYASYLAGAFAAEHARSSRATLPAIAPRPPVFDHTQSTQGISHAHHNQSHTDASPYFTDGTVDYAFAHATGHIATSTHVTNPLLPLMRPGTEFRRSRSIPSRQVAGSSAHHQGPFIPQRLPAPQSSRMRDSRSPTQYRPSALQEKFGTQTRGDPIPDDDIFMADSDDESSVFSDSAAPRRQALMQAWNGPSAELRAFALDVDVFAYMEFTGQASSTGSSMDNMFTYFINVTSPTISLYERHPRDQGAQVGQHGKLTPNNYLWCYTIPLMSFHHPGLQQAILALATLQLANLQNVPATAAMKHYHLALRRIAKNVKVASKRTHIATLAATLLLAYFEVWSSDHTKWCNHLYGARILFLEIPLREMSRKCLPEMRRKERAREELSDSGGKAESLENKAFTDETGLDFVLIRTITGIPVSAQDYGFGEPHLTATTATDRDILTYENYADLFWWYCKMDVYQSILGGTKLLMDYQNWTQCPPRSPLSRVKQICGTYDHLILLLGRLANFAAKDLRRKRQVWKARQTSSSSNDSPQPFPGIIPTQGNYQAPMGFSPPRESSPQSEKIAEDNDASVALALREWETIRQAFNVLKDHFGPEFRPLSGEYADRRESPFGAAVQYRSYAVAGVWMNYYMGLIHLHRAHPRMPPAAMQAAGMTAKETATYANQIGRIAAGLSDDSSKLVDVNPLGAAAFIESSFCLFVAGVQFQDAGQRHWLVQRMHDVSRLTGWRSARQIAGGCESSWTKAALIGHGPRYERNVDSINIPPSVWQNPRRIDKLLRQIERGPGEERRLVLASADRAFYAMGLLGVEEDLNVLDIEDDR